MKKVFFLFILSILFFACQTDELLHSTGSGPSTLILDIKSTGNQTHTRAVSSEQDEMQLRNIYILIFNSDESVAHRQFFDNLNTSAQPKLRLENIPAGIKTVVAIANINNSITDVTTTSLNSVATLTEMMNLSSRIKGDYIERGVNFLMSGMADQVELKPGQDNPAAILLTRIDSKIKFNIIADENKVVFTPQDWRIVSCPKVVPVIPGSAGDLYNYDNNYFASAWAKFETSTPNAVTGDSFGFAFYLLENKVSAKEEIPNAGSYTDQYALREKKDKTDNGNGTVSNGDFRYAPKTGSYVEVRGNVRYKPNATSEISADVVYTIHLGGVKGVNDYNSLRNTAYTYNVRIVSVNQILTEVETGEETRPGAEGDITIAKTIKEIDAYNEVFNLSFHQSFIDQTLSWNVNTPFSQGSDKEGVTDYKWAFFNICNKSNNFYTDDLIQYSGDQNVYSDEEFQNITGYDHFLDKYMSDITARRNKMLNVKQLVAVLKESKNRLNSSKPDLFDYGDNIQFTAYIHDFYYETHPSNTGETAQTGLWKKAVNTKKRVLNILSNFKFSPDGMSSKSNALYSIRQSSIQTMYNRSLKENYTAWGSQMIQDMTMIPFDKLSATTTLNYSDRSNGRKNSVNMWGINTGNNKRWSDFINIPTWQMKSNYESAKYKCLRQNRDMNGDGIINTNEVQWYLASINQLTDLWIGEPSFDSQSKLYQFTTWENRKQWFASSTVSGRSASKDNPEILWSSEGSSIGRLNGSGSVSNPVYYRCVRNLGMAKEAAPETKPDDFVSYDQRTRTISLNKLDRTSLRGFPTEEELPDHFERGSDGYNKPWEAFEVNELTSGSNLTWEQVRRRSQPGSTNKVCPQGWRVPNQRELAIMYSRITRDIWPGIWNMSNHFARTGFSFNTGSRPGFSVSNDGNTYFLLNSNNETGSVRCIRDIQ